MHRPAVPDAYIEEVAERTEFSVDDVRIGLRVLHDAVQSRITEQYRRARDDDAPNHLLRDDASTAWFAFAFADLRAELEAAGYEMDADLLAAVAAVNMTVFQEVHDRTVSFPRDLADASDTPFFYPVYVEKPEWWREAETRALRSFVGLLESGSSPAAALDAWAVSSAGCDPDAWAAVRGVEQERVRANAADAPDPAPEAADGLRAEARDGLPDGPYDPETDRLFVPTTDQLAAARESREEAEASEGAAAVDAIRAADEANDGADSNGDADADAGVEADAVVDADAGVGADATDADHPTDPPTDPDPDGLSELDPDDFEAGEFPPDPLADAPETAGSAAADADETGTGEGSGDDSSDGSASGGRVIDGAEAFERGDDS